MKRLLELLKQTQRPLGFNGQWGRRCTERQIRKRAVAMAHWFNRQGLPTCQASVRLGLHPSTLGRWQRSWLRKRMDISLRGRQQRPRDPLQGLAVSEHLEAMGPSTGLPALRAMFPEVPRSDLKVAQQAHRRRWHETHSLVTEVLTWTVPGTVWATDFTDPPLAIDGVYEHLLPCRDLASSMQLLALPTLYTDAKTAMEAMEYLFRAWGAPLVIKSDNGSSFIAQEFKDFLSDWGVILLLSPPRTPRYNGAVEAGNGTLKVRIRQRAAQHGHPGVWTSDDVEAAIQEANCLQRPFGPFRSTPEQLWQLRQPITPAQRHEFGVAERNAEEEILEEHGMAGELISPLSRSVVVRQAVRRALERFGFLLVQRKRISPPFNSPLWNKIT